MRARMFVSWAVVSGGIVLAISCSAVWSQSNPVPDASQFAGCPTVLPAEEGERSIVVPSIAPHVEPPAQEVPHIASLPQSPEHDAAKSLLREKLVLRDQLQREIIALQESTLTPEQILVHVKVVEINRTRLRKLNVDWSTFGNDKAGKIDVAGLLGVKGPAGEPNRSLQVETNVDPAFLELLQTLERQNVSRALAMPTVVVTNGRPASLVSGHEISLPQPVGAAPRVEKIGTQIDLTAVALGENRVRVEVRPSIREIDASNSPVVGGVTIPAVSVREFDTAMEMELGTTSIFSGLLQERTEATVDQFGQRSDEKQEIALMLIVTPEIVR